MADNTSLNPNDPKIRKENQDARDLSREANKEGNKDFDPNKKPSNDHPTATGDKGAKPQQSEVENFNQ